VAIGKGSKQTNTEIVAKDIDGLIFVALRWTVLGFLKERVGLSLTLCYSFPEGKRKNSSQAAVQMKMMSRCTLAID
jgi:hypothetical protein